jgi:ATP-grasp domain-containing protein
MIESDSKMLTVWLGTRAVDAISFESIIPIDLIVSCDYGSDVAEIEKTRAVYSLEKNKGVKHCWNNFHLNYLFDDDAAAFLMQVLDKQKEDKIQFLCYSSSILLEKFLQTFQLPAINICLPSDKKNIFDDKIMLNQWQKWLDLPVIPSSIELLGDIDFSTLNRKYGNQIVLKFPIGSAGGKVFFIEDFNSFRDLQVMNSSSTVLVQKYVSGIPINLQGVITANTIFWAPPSIQVIGSPECTNNRFEWCGNDFGTSSYLSQADISKLIGIAERIVRELKSDGYVGIIGLDFLFDMNARIPYLLEINPRFQGSTALLTQLEFLNDFPPLLAEQIKAFDGYCPFPADTRKGSGRFDQNGSQVIIHNKNKLPVRVISTLPFGVYSFDSQSRSVVYERKGFTLFDIKSDHEFVVSGGVPISGQIIMPGAPMLWIQFFGEALIDPALGQLNNRTKDICDAVSKMLIAETVEE